MRNSNGILNVILRYTIFIFSLFLMEVVIFSFLIECGTLLNYGFSYTFRNFLDIQVEIFWSTIKAGTVRAMYYPFHIIPFILLVNNIGKERHMLKMAIINGSLALLIPFLYGLIFESKTIDFIDKLWPFVLIIAAVAFLSPFILSRIPYFKKIIQEL